MEKRNSTFSKLFLVIIFFILYAPILFLIIFSFNSGDTMYDIKGFSLQWYRELFHDKRMLIIVFNTIIIALLSALFSTIIGVIGALAIYNSKKRNTKNILLSLNNVLIVSPDVIIGASFLMLFTMAGIKLGFYSVLLSHIAFSIPIVVLMVLPKLMEMSPSLIDAAQDLGASSWDVLSKVVIPFISPGIFAGFFMALTYSLDDFSVTFFVTGNGFSTLSVEIYSLARRGISLNINALSALLFLVTMLLIVIYYFITQRNVNQSKNNLRTNKADGLGVHRS